MRVTTRQNELSEGLLMAGNNRVVRGRRDWVLTKRNWEPVKRETVPIRVTDTWDID